MYENGSLSLYVLPSRAVSLRDEFLRMVRTPGEVGAWAFVLGPASRSIEKSFVGTETGEGDTEGVDYG